MKSVGTSLSKLGTYFASQFEHALDCPKSGGRESLHWRHVSRMGARFFLAGHRSHHRTTASMRIRMRSRPVPCAQASNLEREMEIFCSDHSRDVLRLEPEEDAAEKSIS